MHPLEPVLGRAEALGEGVVQQRRDLRELRRQAGRRIACGERGDERLPAHRLAGHGRLYGDVRHTVALEASFQGGRMRRALERGEELHFGMGTRLRAPVQLQDVRVVEQDDGVREVIGEEAAAPSHVDAGLPRECGPERIVPGALPAVAERERVALRPSVGVRDVDELDRGSVSARGLEPGVGPDPGHGASLPGEPARADEQVRVEGRRRFS